MAYLNQSLYDALVAAVQRGRAADGLSGKRVKVVHEGQPNTWAPEIIDPVSQRPRNKISREGELYQVCCPICKDDKFRLNINHAWGVKDPKTGYKNYFLAHCFNEGCERLEGFVRTMEFILASYSLGSSGRIVIPEGVEPKKKIEPFAPGACVRLDQLPPTHHANRFMLSRGYDVYKLAPKYGLSYCFQSRFVQANERIIFPVAMNGRMMGWQARYVDKDAGGSVKGLWVCKHCGYIRSPNPEAKVELCPRCGTDDIRKASKYWTMPGMSTGENLMNFDQARRYSFCVLVEGPMDVLRVGSPDNPHEPGPAVCLFGHSLSGIQRKYIYETWTSGTVVVLLDPDAYSTQNDIMSDLVGNFAEGVLSVMLPDDRDPGECSHDLIWKLIQAEATRKGANLLKARPPEPLITSGGLRI